MVARRLPCVKGGADDPVRPFFRFAPHPVGADALIGPYKKCGGV